MFLFEKLNIKYLQLVQKKKKKQCIQYQLLLFNLEISYKLDHLLFDDKKKKKKYFNRNIKYFCRPEFKLKFFLGIVF